MFKSTRWRSEKNKNKFVFKLQFHVTQLKQVAGDSLIISVIPADTGKATRLEKAKIKDGSCFWEKPHYETVKLVPDPKSGKFQEKIYQFVLATGSSKSSGVGEVSIDFSVFAEATKISSLCLPIKNAHFAAFLHVSIQRVQDSLEEREIDGSDNANRHERTLRAQLSNSGEEETIRTNSREDHGELIDNTDRQGSSGSDITLSASDISSGLETSHEPDPKNTIPIREPLAATTYEKRHVSQWDWLDGSPTELSTDDSSMSPEEPILEEDGSPEAIIKKLKTELEVLARQADVTELELQTLRKQIVKERKKGLELSREVSAVIEERNALKEECEKLKENRRDTQETKAKVKGDPWDLIDELRQELNHEKDLNSDLRLQLQKTQEANAELILAVQDLDAMLEQKSKSKSKSKSETDEDEDEDQKALEDIVRQHSGMQEAHMLEQKITDLYGEIEAYKRDKDELEMQIDQMALDYEILKQGNHDMCYKLEQSQLQEELNMQYECTDVVNELETQIESLKHELNLKSEKLSKSVLAIEELETQIESLKHELNLKSEKLSESVHAIEELESIIKNLENDLEDQADGFEADIEDLVTAKVAQEQRAVRAEDSIRKMKLQNVKTAERLQEEFRRLLKQMNSSFEANEKVAMKAMDEANQLRAEKRCLEETIKKLKRDLDFLNASYEEKVVDLLGQISQKSKEIERLEEDNKILEDERENLENVNKQIEGEYERFKSLYNDMKVLLIDDENEKEKLRKQVSQLKEETKKNEDALISTEKKLKEDNHTVARNSLENQIELLEGQIKSKETALKCSENSFLEKEKDLQFKIKQLESSAISQESASDELELLKNLNKSMEVELMEMQERYSEISLKFAEVEGERQQLVMTLRNLKNAKK